MKKINFRGSKAIIISDFPSGPTNYYFYGIRHSETDWDDPQTIEQLVVVNRWGFIGFKERIAKKMKIPRGKKGLCKKCGCHILTHNDDGSCVKE